MNTTTILTDIKFEICFNLRKENISFTQEYYDQFGTSWNKFDIALLNKENKLIGIIEVVNEFNEIAQLEKYETFKVPICLCRNVEQIGDVLNFSKECAGNKLVIHQSQINSNKRRKLAASLLDRAKKLHDNGLNSTQIAKKIGIERKDIRQHVRIWKDTKRLAKKLIVDI